MKTDATYKYFMTFMRSKLINQKIYHNPLQIKTHNTISEWNLLLGVLPKVLTNPISQTSVNTSSHLQVAIFIDFTYHS